jgi:hypothetical protein
MMFLLNAKCRILHRGNLFHDLSYHFMTFEGGIEASSNFATYSIRIQSWVRSVGLEEGAASHLLDCLSPTVLLAQPKPTTKYRRGKFSAKQNLRYLSHRRAAKLLGWCDQQKFPADIKAIVKRVYCEDAPKRGLGLESTKSSTPASAGMAKQITLV